MPGAIKRRWELPQELQGEQIVSLQVASEITGLSVDAWKDNYPELIIRLSPRRLGIKLRHVLGIGQTPPAA